MESNKAFTTILDFKASKANKTDTYRIGLATRDVAGYELGLKVWQVGGRDVSLSHAIIGLVEAEAIAEKLNYEYFNINPEQALKIVASSIKAQNARNSQVATNANKEFLCWHCWLA